MGNFFIFIFFLFYFYFFLIFFGVLGMNGRATFGGCGKRD